MEPEARKAEIDRERPLDLVAAVVEQLPLVGHRVRHPVADDVHRHRAWIEEAEMEQLHPERAVPRGEQGPVGPEADVPVIVEAEPVQGSGSWTAEPRRAPSTVRGPVAPHPRIGTDWAGTPFCWAEAAGLKRTARWLRAGFAGGFGGTECRHGGGAVLVLREGRAESRNMGPEPLIRVARPLNGS